MKSIREKDLEKAFLRAMNKLVANKEALLIEETGCASSTEDIDTRLAELQQELMNVVRMSGVDSEEYSRVVGEIEALRERKIGIKNSESEGAWRKSKLEEFNAYLAAQGTHVDRFDGDMFRRLIEKVKIMSMVEVVFVFKAEVQEREIL